MELGTIGNVAYGAPSLRTPYSAISQTRIADDDTSVAVIQHSHRAGLSSRRNYGNADSTTTTMAERLRDFLKLTEQKVEKYRQLTQEISDGPFSAASMRSWASLQTPGSTSTHAARIQGNVEPDRVLDLLKDPPKSPAERAMELVSGAPS